MCINEDLQDVKINYFSGYHTVKLFNELAKTCFTAVT